MMGWTPLHLKETARQPAKRRLFGNRVVIWAYIKQPGYFATFKRGKTMPKKVRH